MEDRLKDIDVHDADGVDDDPPIEPKEVRDAVEYDLSRTTPNSESAEVRQSP